MSVPYSRIHQQGQKQVPAHSNTTPAPVPDPTFKDPFHTLVPRTYSQAGPAADPGSEYYTLTHGINHQIQYQPSRGVHRTTTLPAPTGANTHGRRLPVRNLQHPPQNKFSKADNHGTEIPLTRTPQRSRQATPSNSRRGSAVSTNMGGGTNAAHSWGLQCHFIECRNIFGNDNSWREHKIYSCRSRYYSQKGFQCSFIACPVSTRSHREALDQEPPDATAASTPTVAYDSLAEVLEHEREHHEVLVCTGCNFIFRATEADEADEHRIACPARASGRPDAIDVGPGPRPQHSQPSGQSSSANHQGVKLLHLWVVDIQYVLNNRYGYDRSHFVDLRYPERFGEEDKMTPDQGSTSDFVKSTNLLMEPLRTAMAKQLIGTLRLHNKFLTSASETALELTLQEKNDVRECLTDMAKLLRIELNTECSLPEIKVSVSPANNPIATSHSLQAGNIGVVDAAGLEVAATEDIDPSQDPRIRSPLITPRIILSRSSSPARQPTTQPITQLDDIIAAEPQPPVDAGVLPRTSPNKSVLSFVGTGTGSTVVVTTEDGEPLQETHIPGLVQYEYFVQMMNCCLEAVYQWFDRNQEVLLENCECSILNAPPVGEQTQGVQSPIEGKESTTQAQLTKTKRKRNKKNQAAAVAAASGPPGDDTATQNPPTCFLHSVKGPDSSPLPRWTHHLRRLVDQGRIPASIISNKESFSGEIQPVDEVRHAVKKKKEKTDRDLLALVQQARKFCWQLKDWEKCRQLDDLYDVLEGKIKLAKNQEGWKTVGSWSRRGRRSHMRGESLGQATGGTGDGPGVLTPSFTWPRLGEMGCDD